MVIRSLGIEFEAHYNRGGLNPGELELRVAEQRLEAATAARGLRLLRVLRLLLRLLRQQRWPASSEAAAAPLREPAPE